MCRYSPIPVLSTDNRTVSRQGRLIPYYSYCMVYESLKRLFEYIEVFASKPKEYDKTHIIEFLTMQSSVLINSAKEISPEAWGDALFGAITLQRYLVDGDEPSKDEAKRQFVGFWKTLYLDELFKKRPAVIEKEVPDFRR